MTTADRKTATAAGRPEPDGELHRSSSAVVIGASAGGLEALAAVLEPLPADYRPPILLVQHLHPSDGGQLAAHLDRQLAVRVIEARDKQAIRAGCVHVAPADYHLLVERDWTLALSVDEPVCWSRPSIDVLFDSAARVWGRALVGVVLSGANHDGAAGLRQIGRFGGLTVVQRPRSALHPVMPQSAIDAGPVAEVLEPPAIGRLLARLGRADDAAGGAAARGAGDVR
jgi:two-component system chemotaxis response regulator CheB